MYIDSRNIKWVTVEQSKQDKARVDFDRYSRMNEI
jgi:hypothetical protein